MEPLCPIFWGQGMFLQPQHFQQQDNYHEVRLRSYLHLLNPFCWGVKSLSINETALQNFEFDVEHCELVTLEGTIIRFQGEFLPSNARIAPRAFETFLASGEQPLGVYLALKRWQWEESNIEMTDALSGNGAATERHRRFSVKEWLTPDLFAEDGQGSSLKYLVHDVQLLFEPETAEAQDYELVKLAELLRSSEGQGAMLSRRYIPPALSVHASAVLSGMLKEIRDVLTAKGRELSEFKRQRSLQTLDMGSRDAMYVLMMQLVNRYIPLFHHYLEVEVTHPCVFYALLRQLVGELSTFSEDVSVLGGPLPAYRHDQLYPCFNAAVQVALRLINELARGPEYVVPLTFDDSENYFTADLDQRFFEGNNHYYLSIKVDLTLEELRRRLSETGKITCREEIEDLRRQALFGLGIDYQENPPEELPRRLGTRYFAIDRHDSFWRSIQENQNIAVDCDLDRNTEIQLLIISED